MEQDLTFHHDLSDSISDRDRNAFLVHVHADIFSGASHKRVFLSGWFEASTQTLLQKGHPFILRRERSVIGANSDTCVTYYRLHGEHPGAIALEYNPFGGASRIGERLWFAKTLADFEISEIAARPPLLCYNS